MCDFDEGGRLDFWVPEEVPEETIPLQAVDAVTVTVLMDNVADMLLSDQGPAHRFDWIPSQGSVFVGGVSMDCPRAEHGFSVLIGWRQGERQHRVLFDAGVSPLGMVENMSRLGVSPGDVEAVVLSHGHWDHVGGLEGLARRLGPRRLPMVIHPEFWNRRRIVFDGPHYWELPTACSKALREAGFEVIERLGPSLLFDKTFLVTGEVDRTTTFERGMMRQQAWKDGQWVPDPLVRDDQAVVLNLRDEGLIVLTGCGHAGIVNIVRQARRITGVKRVHAVLGGFHLNGAVFGEVIPQVCDALAEMGPRWIVPGHCTGPRALQALMVRFPDGCLVNSVGTRYQFEGSLK